MGPPPSYDEARSGPMFSTCFLTFLIIVQTLALLIIFLAPCGLSYEVNRVNVICQSIQTSESEKKPFLSLILVTKVVHFLHPCVRVFECRS